MGKLVFYGAQPSPPSRAVLLMLKELGLEYEYKNVDLRKDEQKIEEFLKKNPQHTVPVLEDDDITIWDSHAILAYLARKYGKTDALYPNDFYQRAVIDQRLHFDSGILFSTVMKGILSPQKTKEDKLASIEEAYDFLEKFLTDTYLAGDHLTIADLSILPSVMTIDLITPVKASGTRPKLAAWLELLKQLSYCEEVNAESQTKMAAMLQPIIASINGDS